MKYEKPEIKLEGNALQFVKHTGDKQGCVLETTHLISSGCAYEADE